MSKEEEGEEEDKDFLGLNLESTIYVASLCLSFPLCQKAGTRMPASGLMGNCEFVEQSLGQSKSCLLSLHLPS